MVSLVLNLLHLVANTFRILTFSWRYLSAIAHGPSLYPSDSKSSPLQVSASQSYVPSSIRKPAFLPPSRGSRSHIILLLEAFTMLKHFGKRDRVGRDTTSDERLETLSGTRRRSSRQHARNAHNHQSTADSGSARSQSGRSLES